MAKLLVLALLLTACRIDARTYLEDDTPIDPDAAPPGTQEVRVAGTAMTTLTVREGDSDTLEVTLRYPPGGSLAVRVEAADATVAAADPPTLTFDDSNFDAPQLITISGTRDDDNEPATTSVSLTATGAVSAAVDVTVTDDTTAAVLVPAGDITTATTWTASNVYVLTGQVFVRGVTLTIESGTTILADDGASLVIASDAQIEASGTPSQPIVFTSSRTPATTGDWQGIVLLGLAPINVAGGTLSVEGYTAGTATFGGTAPAHDCGTLRYVRVHYAGGLLAPDQESNGVTLAGCGTGTVIDYLQVHRGSDDGVEIFGGTVRVSHLLLTQNDDDALDWDFGWTGGGQFVITQLTAAADNAFEGDNQSTMQDAVPRSAPAIWNFTAIGHPTNPNARGGFLRRGTAGQLRNGIFYDFNRVAVDVVDSTTIAQWTSGNLDVRTSIFHSATSVYWPSGFDADDFDEQAAIMTPARGNRIADPRLLAPHDTLVLNVLPQGGSPALSGAGTPPAGFDTTATYCGALGTGDWTVGWTAYPP